MNMPRLSLPALALLAVLGGCDALSGILLPTSTTIELVNDSDFDINVLLYTSGEEHLPESLLDDIGREHERQVAAGGRSAIRLACDDANAVLLDRADLLVIAGIGPTTQSGALRSPDDFLCGDTIVMTFDHSSALFDFGVSVDVVRGVVLGGFDLFAELSLGGTGQ